MQNTSNIINLFEDDMRCESGRPQVSGKAELRGNSIPRSEQTLVNLPLESTTGSTSITVSTMPQSRTDRDTMVEIEERLYRYPAIAQATAFRFESENGDTGYGAAVVLFDWIEKMTVADIRKWITAHLDSVTLPIEIVKVESGLFTT